MMMTILDDHKNINIIIVVDVVLSWSQFVTLSRGDRAIIAQHVAAAAAEAAGGDSDDRRRSR